MGKIFIPCDNAECWKPLLADKKHWKKGFSARTLAYSWQEANGFPESINNVLKKSDYPIFNNVELLLAIPEYKVPLKGGTRPSQNDVFALAKGNNELISITIEGKVNEAFGSYIDKWNDGSKGKIERLSFLYNELGLSASKLNTKVIRYQLLHRTVSAILEAKRFNALNALMLIHAFKDDNYNPAQLDDFKEFANLFGINSQLNQIHHAKTFNKSGITLYLGWVEGDKKFLDS